MVLKNDKTENVIDDRFGADCNVLIKYKKIGKYLVPVAEVSPETGEVLRVIERGRPYEIE